MPPVRGREWRRWSRAGLPVALVLVMGWLCCATDQRPRHLIWISLDTTRADHLGPYGNRWIRTPNLDSFAREAVQLADYSSVASTTLSSHVSSFTGRYPHSHGVAGNGWRVPEENLMLAEVLRQAGFRTVGFPASFALEHRFGISQGFEHYDDRGRQEVGLPVVSAEQNDMQRSAREVTDSVVAYLEQQGIPTRLFLFVHYFDAHRAGEEVWDVDYTPRGPQAYRLLYEGAGVSDGSRAERERFLAARRSIDVEGGEAASLTYAQQISYVDHELGRLLAFLRKRGALDDALVVITSDHGEVLWEREPGFMHAPHVHQAVIRGVAMIRFPDAWLAGQHFRRPAASIDLMPTLLGYLGIPLPEGLDGTILLLGDGAARARARSIFAEATGFASYEVDYLSPGDAWPNVQNQRAVRRGRYKFLATGYNGYEELYDLVRDPLERKNLLEGGDRRVGRYRRIADLMRTELERWTRPAPYESENLKRIEEETNERLRALGYAR